MGIKQLKKNLAIDATEYPYHGFLNHEWGKPYGFSEIAPMGAEEVRYYRGSKRVERYEGKVRTHVFHCKIPAHKWATFIQQATVASSDNWREKSASAATWQEYVDGRDYTADEIEEIKQAFNELKLFSQNHSVAETLEERERLGLIT